MNKTRTTLGERIKFFRVQKGVSQKVLAIACGWGQSRLGNYEANSREPTIADLQLIADALSISINDLIEDSTAEQLVSLKRARQAESFQYPVISNATAGNWKEAFREEHHKESEPSDYRASGPAFWFRVSNDSMTSPTSPSFPNGALVLVDTGLDARPGDFVVAVVPDDSEATFKQLVRDAGRLYLNPLNQRFSPIQIDDECEIIGVVKRMMLKI